MTTRRLRFGIKTAPQRTTYDDILRVWQEADAVPIIEHAWVFDHFVPLGANPAGPCLEGWTLLAALAARTDRLRVGVMVTSNTYRHPAVLANMGATVDALSHGRLDFGIGAGWHEQEHAMYGIPLYGTLPAVRSRSYGARTQSWTRTARPSGAIRRRSSAPSRSGSIPAIWIRCAPRCARSLSRAPRTSF